MAGKNPDAIGFCFGIGHGHYTQFLNFQECFPSGCPNDVEWIPMYGDSSGDALAKLLPRNRRYARNQLWHIKQGISRHRHWQALFIAGSQIGLLPFTRRHSCYFYTDLTPSLMSELSPWYDHKLYDTSVLKYLKAWADQQLYRTCRGFFTMSRWAARGIEQDFGVPKNKIHVVHPGANLNKWHFVDRSDRPQRQPVRILMVGGQFELKGGSMLLDWAENTSLTNWEMDIVTWPGELPDWVSRLVDNSARDSPISASLEPRLPNVRVHCGLKANTPEIMSLFEQADIFCLPTQADGSSIASLEAMASGLPVLVGAAGGIPELITDGETGFLQNRSDASDLKSKLDLLISDASLRQSIGVAARKSCETYYNVPRQLGEILQIMEAGASG